MAAFAISIQKISPIWRKNRPHHPLKKYFKKIKKRVKIKKKTPSPL
jgi:hypothetical protein